VHPQGLSNAAKSYLRIGVRMMFLNFHIQNLLLRAVLMSAGTAPNFETAKMAKTISGELLMNTAMNVLA
jgi:hypothetical protein